MKKCVRKIRKSTIDKIQRTLEAESYTFTSCFNDGRGIRFRSTCPNGHDYEAYWQGFRREGKRCKQCYNKRRRPTTEYVKQQFEQADLAPLFKEYKDSKTKLPYRCKKCGLKHQISWNKFKDGCRCPQCGIKKSAVKRSIDYKEVKNSIESASLALLSADYINAHVKLKYQCMKCGLKHQINWNKFQSGHRCPKCSKVKSAETRRIDFAETFRLFEVEGYKIVNIRQVKNRKNSKNKFTLKCPKGHQFDTCWNYWQRGIRCPKCSNQQSKGELEIVEYLRSKGIYVIERNRSILGGKELDMFCPDKEWFETRGVAIPSSTLGHPNPRVSPPPQIHPADRSNTKVDF